MSSLMLVSVSTESDLLEEIDLLCREHRFASRSNGLRQHFRTQLQTRPGTRSLPQHARRLRGHNNAMNER